MPSGILAIPLVRPEMRSLFVGFGRRSRNPEKRDPRVLRMEVAVLFELTNRLPGAGAAS
jgi:hypothetical protein